MFWSPGGSACMLLHSLSHVWNSWTHRSSQPTKANPWKHSAISAAIPWCAASCHPQLFALSLCFVLPIHAISIQPTCELDARPGGDYVGLAREKRGGGQRNGRHFGQSPRLPLAPVVLAVRGTTATAPLQSAVSAHLTTYVDEMCVEETQRWKERKKRSQGHHLEELKRRSWFNRTVTAQQI